MNIQSIFLTVNHFILQAITVFLGEKGIAKDSMCIMKAKNENLTADTFETAQEYSASLEEHCRAGRSPAVLFWIPDAKTPNLVYYGVNSVDSFG